MYRFANGSIAAVLWPCLVFGVEPDAGWTASGVFVEPQAIKRVNPRYPGAAQRDGLEGWVAFEFCVGVDGRVMDPTIVDASGKGEFVDVAMTAFTQWRYAPATLNGAPLERCGVRVVLRFDLDSPSPRVASPAFVARARAITDLIEARRLDEAAAALEALDLNSEVERAIADLLRADVAATQGDFRTELTWLRGARQAELSPAVDLTVRRREFRAQLALSQTGSALKTFASFSDTEVADLSATERAAAAQLDAHVRSAEPIATPGLLSSGPSGLGTPSWSSPLLRRSFAFHEATAGVARFECHCEARSYFSPVVADKTWSVPGSWGDCTITVFGDDGGTFTLVEYADVEPS